MAILYNGINGPFSGKVGTVVGYKWKNKSVMRGLPSTRKGRSSPLQIQQHAKFRLMNAFLIPLVNFLNITYNSIAVGMSGYNKAFSYNVKNAIGGIFPEFVIDYPAVLVSRGDLPNVQLPNVSSPVSGTLEFSWADNSGKGKAKSTDNAFAALYNEENGHWVCKVNLATRNAGECILDLGSFKAKVVHSYFGFISADGKEVTDSIYTGPVSL
jgi:Family of unknown function (DUF6266)